MAKQINTPLPSGSKLQQYTLERVISTGGFSIVYLAYNENGIPVAIKEFMPAGMQLRSSPYDTQLKFKEREEERRFQMGLKSFFREAEAISRIDDRSVARILNFFLSNQTAYLVMPFEHGRTLQRIIAREFETLSDQQLQRVFCDILRGVCIFHANDILHLDLKPSNIWMRSDASAMILDFGTSRIGHESRSQLPPMHTPGFAAPEQHRRFYKPELLGIWTDIYNLGATIFACIEGEPPQASDARMENDEVPLLEHRWAGQYSPKLLRMIDRMLRLDQMRRPQDAQAILHYLQRYSPMPNRDVFPRFCRNAFYS